MSIIINIAEVLSEFPVQIDDAKYIEKRLISLKNVITVDPLKYGIGNVTI